MKPFEPRPPVGTDPFGPGSFRSQLDRARSAANDLSLILSRDNDRILGGVNLSQIVMGPFRSAYLGYWIGRPYLRQGFMTEALQLALRRAFRTHGLHRVEANILTHNTASRALVKRAGFRREGLSPRYLKIAGRWQDHERWALLEEEWVPVGRTYLVPTT